MTLGLNDGFVHDLRHVQRPVVDHIVDSFSKAFFRDTVE